jgi:hypothetical protein
MKLANIPSNILNVLEKLSIHLADNACLFEVSSLKRPTSLILWGINNNKMLSFYLKVSLTSLKYMYVIYTNVKGNSYM